MVKCIVKDESFLSQKSVMATEEDKQIAIDLLDTLEANKDKCVGLAANMIGELKNIIAAIAHSLHCLGLLRNIRCTHLVYMYLYRYEYYRKALQFFWVLLCQEKPGTVLVPALRF